MIGTLMNQAGDRIGDFEMTLAYAKARALAFDGKVYYPNTVTETLVSFQEGETTELPAESVVEHGGVVEV